jgi:peptide/nickel transport system substrate-binding protein
MKRLIRIVAAVATLGILAADVAQGQGTPSGGSEAKGKPGGVVRTRIHASIKHLDPVVTGHGAYAFTLFPMLSNLVKHDPLDPKGVRLVADLAESWKVSDSGEAVEFKLRNGLKWSDGKPLTAEDVKFTFDIIRDPPAKYVSARKGLWASIKMIETPDPRTIRFILHAPSASFLSNLAWGWTKIMPKHTWEDDGGWRKNKVGSGPFVIQQDWQPSMATWTYRRNPHYYEPGRPYLDGLEFSAVPDVNSAVAALMGGRFDALSPGMYGGVTEEIEADILRRRPNLKAYRTVGFTFAYFAMNTKKQPFTDVRVRQAVSEAIDRKQFACCGPFTGAVSAIMHPGGQWARPLESLQNLPGYGQNMDARIANAKKLLATAGYPNGFSTTMHFWAGHVSAPQAEMAQAMLAKIGINLTLVPTQDLRAVEGTGQHAMSTISFAVADDPDVIFGGHFITNGGRNYAYMSIPELDDLFVKQSRMMDLAQRKDIVHRMERLAIEHAGYVVLDYGWGQTIREKDLKFVGHNADQGLYGDQNHTMWNLETLYWDR